MSNRIAPKGQVFVCGACGKRSRDEYGDQAIDRGWDESCVLNAILCYEDKLLFHPMNGKVVEVREGGVVLETEERGEEAAEPNVDGIYKEIKDFYEIARIAVVPLVTPS